MHVGKQKKFKKKFDKNITGCIMGGSSGLTGKQFGLVLELDEVCSF